MNCLGKSLLLTLTKHYNEHGLCSRDFMYKGRNNKAVSFQQAKKIIDYLTSVSNIHALALPGRVPGTYVYFSALIA